MVARAGGKTTAIGYDGRLSSPELAEVLSNGLRASGIQVLNIGRGPTPMLYYTATTMETGGAVMVTGSHNPPDYNGLKMMIGGETLYGDAITALRTRAESGELTTGSGASIMLSTLRSSTEAS